MSVPGVGQVWRQAELPALLSNDKVKRIYSVCKRNGQLQTKLEFPDDEGEVSSFQNVQRFRP